MDISRELEMSALAAYMRENDIGVDSLDEEKVSEIMTYIRQLPVNKDKPEEYFDSLESNFLKLVDDRK